MKAAVRNLSRVGRIKARRPLRALRHFNAIRALKRSQFPLQDFKAKNRIYQSTSQFILKTAESPFELRQVLKLRHDIFYQELQGRAHESNLDFDEYDSLCDHLIIIDRKTRRIVGTYRVISSTFSDRFYSQGEFELGGVLALPGNKLELGRACIHAEFRTGAIINLLWKGIGEYIRVTSSEYLFGCASVNSVDPVAASRLLQQLRNKELAAADFGVAPTGPYRCELPCPLADAGPEEEIPALIQSYILAGAKFYGEPALDADFGCFDFFMMLKVADMSRLFKRRYGL